MRRLSRNDTEFAKSRTWDIFIRNTTYFIVIQLGSFKGGRMGRSDKVSLWYVSLLINTRFHIFILEYAIVKRI